MEYTFDIPEASIPQERGLRVRFHRESKEDKALTKANGIATHVLVDYVEIRTPGDPLSVIDRPVKDEDKAKYAAQWKAFEAGKNQEEVSGTPLSVLGIFPKNRIDDLRYHGIVTAENYLAASDANISKIGPTARREQQRVREIMEAAKSRTPMLKLQAENDELRKRTVTLEQQVEQLMAKVNGDQNPPAQWNVEPKPKRKYTRKPKTEVASEG